MSAPTKSVVKEKMTTKAKKRKNEGKKAKIKNKVAKLSENTFSEVDFKFMLRDDKTVLDGNLIIAHM